MPPDASQAPSPRATPQVIVAHPGRQHSHQAALALFKAGLLHAYWTGIPCLAEHERLLPAWVKQRIAGQPIIDLPRQIVSWNPVAPIMRRGGSALFGRKLGAWFEYAGYSAFDRWAARKLAGIRPSAVIGYENAALHSFRTVSEKDVLKILDAASIHHTAQDRVSQYSESDALHRWIGKVKDREIALADHILTVSTLAKQTYIDAGVSPEKVSVVPVGADLALFEPREAGRIDASGRFRFVFVGNISHRKGFDLLVRAFAGLRRGARDVDLVVVGGLGDAARYLTDPETGVSYLGQFPHQELSAVYAAADCLVLPARHDSYGMVVAEALACGVPVIVSDMVGAKDWVVAGENGWVVPFNDARALEQSMAWCIENRDAVRAMRARARATALQMSWTAYREKIIATVKQLLNEKARKEFAVSFYQ